MFPKHVDVMIILTNIYNIKNCDQLWPIKFFVLEWWIMQVENIHLFFSEKAGKQENVNIIRDFNYPDIDLKTIAEF